MFKSLSTSLMARGSLAVAVGIIALAWPSVTVLALVILFAIYAFIAAGLQAARAFSSRNAGPVIGHLLLGLADLAAGAVALAWPGPTALVLVLIVGGGRSSPASSSSSPPSPPASPAGTRAMQSMMTVCIHGCAYHPRRVRRRRTHDEDPRGSGRPVFAGLPPQLD